MSQNNKGVLRYSQQMKRYDRAVKEPLYLLDKYYETTEEYDETTGEIINRTINDDCLIFKICGSTKNIYTVRIQNCVIECDCPDYMSGCARYGVICKHCCFVLYKVLRLLDDIFQPLKHDMNLTLTETHINYLKHRFTIMVMGIQLNDLRGDILVDKSMLSKYKNMKMQKDSESHTCNNKFVYDGDLESAKKKIDECPICFGDFDLSTKMAICPVCSNILHLKCAIKWINMGQVSCVYCRSEVWKDYKKENAKAKYDNLM
jgi:hypothetical protein